jgi:hypothetical protein
MKTQTINRLKSIGWYLAQLIACGVLFVVLIVGLWYFGMTHFDLSWFFQHGSDDKWFYPLMYTVPALAVIGLSVLLNGKKLREILKFWAITACLGVIIGMVAGFVNVFGNDIENYFELRRVKKESDYSFAVGSQDYYIMLEEKQMYFHSDKYFGYYELVADHEANETDLEKEAFKTWDVNEKVKTVFAMSYEGKITSFYAIDSDGNIYKTWNEHYL